MADVEIEGLLSRFVAAWNAHDVETLLDCMTEDAIFYAAAGADPRGSAYAGRDELREAFSAIWRAYHDARWSDSHHFISGDRAVTEWTFTGTGADGRFVQTRGCDLFVIRHGKIAVKDTFRKQLIHK